MNWVKFEDKPLAKVERRVKGGSVVTSWESRHIDKSFIAAVKTNNGHWIEKCIIKDGIGLCVMCDDEYVPAPWEIDDIDSYIMLRHMRKKLM